MRSSSSPAANDSLCKTRYVLRQLNPIRTQHNQAVTPSRVQRSPSRSKPRQVVGLSAYYGSLYLIRYAERLLRLDGPEVHSATRIESCHDLQMLRVLQLRK